MAAGAGLRFGEVAGLRTDRIEFLNRRIQVVQQMQDRELVALKSKAVPRRTVPVDGFILDRINEHIAMHAPDGLLITNRLGGPVQRNSFGHCWRRAVERAALPKGTRFHDLRHWFAATLIAANLNPKVIQTRLGHTTIKETMDTYGHLFPDAADLGRGAIEAMFAEAAPRSELTAS